MYGLGIEADYMTLFSLDGNKAVNLLPVLKEYPDYNHELIIKDIRLNTVCEH